MKLEQQKFIILNRIILLLSVPLVIAFAVSFLFTGNLRCMMLSLFTIPLILVPLLAERFSQYRPSHFFTTLYYFCCFFCYCGNVPFQLNRWIPFYDALCHIILGLFFAMVGLTLPNCLRSLRTRVKPDRLVLAFGCLFSIAAGTVVELIELIYCSILLQPPSALHSITDLAVILLSPIVFCLLLYRFRAHPALSFPIRAMTDVIARNSRPAKVKTNTEAT